MGWRVKLPMLHVWRCYSEFTFIMHVV